MALDEPNESDLVIDQEGFSVLVDPQTKDVVSQSGGLTIDYVDEANQKGWNVISMKNDWGQIFSFEE